MKTVCMYFVLFLISDPLAGQHKRFHSHTGVKINLLSHFGLGAEFPLAKRFTAEFYARMYAFAGGSVTGDVYKTNVRANLKYHIPDRENPESLRSVFVLAGINSRHWTATWKKSESLLGRDELSARMGVLGAGIRGKRLECWLAGEYALHTRYNRSVSWHYGSSDYRYSSPWLPAFSVSGGIAFYLFQSR